MIRFRPPLCSIALAALLSWLVGVPALAAWEPIPVSGRVVGEDGLPRTGLTVQLERAPLPGSPAPEPVTTSTGPLGIFHARVPEPGYWRVVLRPNPDAPPVSVTLPYQPVVEPADWGDLVAGEPSLGQGFAAPGGLLPADDAAPPQDGTELLRFRLVAAETGRGIAGAVVRVSPRDDRWARSDGDGVVELAVPAPAANHPRLQLVIHAAGRRDTSLRRTEIDPGQEVSLQAAAVLSGHAVDLSGAPLADVRISRDYPSGLPMPVHPAVRTGPDGAFALALSQPSVDIPGHLAAVHPERPLARHRYDSLDAGERRAGLRVVVPVGVTAAGVVVGPHGQPVPGATVRLHHTQQDVFVMTSLIERTTDDRGRFAAPGLPQGLHDLSIAAAGYPTTHRRGLDLSAPVGGPPVVDLGTIALEAGARVVGLVTGEDRRPIDGALVTWSQPRIRFVADSGADHEELRTDRDGRFEIVDLLAGAPLIVTVRDEGHLPIVTTISPTTPDDDAPRATDADPLLLVLRPAASVVGRVESPNGEPVPNARVQAGPRRDLGTDDRWFTSDGTVTDEDGRFTLDRVAPGEVEVVAQAAGWAETRRAMTLEAGAEPPFVVLGLEAGATLTGRVVDADGTPLPWASVSLQPPRSPPFVERTDDGGSFEFSGLVLGEHRVRISHDEYAPHDGLVTVVPGDNRWDVALTDRGSSVSGRVLRADGAPAAGARVLVSRAGPDWEPRGEHRTGDDGAFVVRGLPATLVTLAARDHDHGIQRQVDLTDGSVGGLELVLGGAGRIRGRIVGLDPGRLAEVSVRILGPSLHEPRVSSDGTFVVDSLGTGEWRVGAWSPGGRQAAATVVLETEGQEESVELDLTPGEIVLDGTVRIEGVPTGGLVVLLTTPPDASPFARRVDQGSQFFEGRTDLSGRFRLAGLPPGSYRLSVGSPPGIVHEETLELGANRNVEIDLDTAHVSGSVVDPTTGLGLEGVEVRLVRAQALDALAANPPALLTGPGDRTDELGRFEIGPVGAGRHLLVVADQDPATAPVVDLSNGLDVVGLVVSPPGS